MQCHCAQEHGHSHGFGDEVAVEDEHLHDFLREHQVAVAARTLVLHDTPERHVEAWDARHRQARLTRRQQLRRLVGRRRTVHDAALRHDALGHGSRRRRRKHGVTSTAAAAAVRLGRARCLPTSRAVSGGGEAAARLPWLRPVLGLLLLLLLIHSLLLLLLLLLNLGLRLGCRHLRLHGGVGRNARRKCHYDTVVAPQFKIESSPLNKNNSISNRFCAGTRLFLAPPQLHFCSGCTTVMATLSAAATASARTEDEHEYERTDEREGDGDDGELEDFAMSSEDEGGGGREPALDEAMMNELLLVCSNLGMLRVQNEGEEPVLMRGEDCDAWIHDLQRAIRRDHVKHKLVAKQLGKWKVLQKKLLPLLVNHQHDWCARVAAALTLLIGRSLHSLPLLLSTGSSSSRSSRCWSCSR
jgi:hypothetical protein